MLLTLRGCRFGMPFWEGEIRAGYDSKNQELIQNPDFQVIFDDSPKSVNFITKRIDS